MSWQAYVDSSLVGTGQLDKAAIFNIEGTSVWAASPGFQLSPEEMQAVVAAFKDSSSPKAIQTSGIHIAGLKYLVLRADDESIYAKQGKEGIVIVKTKQALLVTHYPASVQPGNATNIVEKLGSYLKSLNY